MTSNQVASTKGKHFGLGFEIYDLGNEEYALSHGGSDKVQNHCVYFTQNKASLLILPPTQCKHI
jgi:hypothetical protein